MVCLLLLFFSCMGMTAAGAQEYYTTEEVRSQYDQLSGGGTVYAPTASPAKNDDTQPLSPGMEVKNVGGINVIVPQGTRVHKEGSQIVYEDLGEYLGRRFHELEQLVFVMQKEISRQSAQLEALRQDLEALKGGRKP